MSELALTDSWVLGHVQTTDFSDADKAALQDKFRLFILPTIRVLGRDALNALDVQTFSNLDDAILVLDNIVSILSRYKKKKKKKIAQKRCKRTRNFMVRCQMIHWQEKRYLKVRHLKCRQP
ncbi:hypothetical protein [Vibrio parahaemolyticus]|uniref:hypothetical protein n=1 Tax=Vibrio parahaemolyticus TaxID=670 RepID=UPI00214C4B31|nr:hypothetical protein [Vibrio parahaemolyticus]